MLTREACSAPRFRIAVLCAMMATLLFVPSLVRATRAIRQPDSASLRLNRGFEEPPTKRIIAPPVSEAIHSAVSLAPVPEATGFAAAPDEPLPAASHDAPPDPLRGPPQSSHS